MKLGIAFLTAGTLLFAAVGMQNEKSQPEKKPEQKQEHRDGPGGPREGQGDGQRRGPGMGQGASVEAGMKGMNRALRTLKGQVTDAAKRDDNLQLVSQMQIACVSAKGGKLDEKLKDLKPEEAAAKKKEFRSEMISLMRTLLDVEAALLNEKYDDAQKALEKAEATRDHGHKEMGVKDD